MYVQEPLSTRLGYGILSQEKCKVISTLAPARSEDRWSTRPSGLLIFSSSSRVGKLVDENVVFPLGIAETGSGSGISLFDY